MRVGESRGVPHRAQGQVDLPGRRSGRFAHPGAAGPRSGLLYAAVGREFFPLVAEGFRTGRVRAQETAAGIRPDQGLKRSRPAPRQTWTWGSPNVLRLPSMCVRMSTAAFSGSGSTAKLAPTASFRPSVRSFTMFMLPVTGGMGPSTV